MLLHILNLQDTGSRVVCSALRFSVRKHTVLATPGIPKSMIEVSKIIKISFYATLIIIRFLNIPEIYMHICTFSVLLPAFLFFDCLSHIFTPSFETLGTQILGEGWELQAEEDYKTLRKT